MRRTHVSLTSSTRGALIAVAIAGAAACNARPSTTSTPAAIRLVDEVKKETIAGGGAPHRDIPRTEWRFDQAVKDKWDALAGVSGLAVKDGKLSGRASTAFPLIISACMTAFMPNCARQVSPSPPGPRSQVT